MGIEEGHAEGAAGPGEGIGVAIAGGAVLAGDGATVLVVVLLVLDDLVGRPAFVVDMDGVEPELVDQAGVDQLVEVEEAALVGRVLEAVEAGERVSVEGG